MRKATALKIVIALLLIIMMLFNFSSCMFINENMESDEKLKLDFEIKIGNDIIDSLKEQDCDKLSRVFCKKIANTKYLNDNINNLFNYINSNGGLIIPDGKWVLRGSGHSSYNGWGKVVDCGGWDYDKEIMLGGKKYVLQCMAYFILSGLKEYEGITHISLMEDIDISNINLLNKINDAIYKYGRPQNQYMGIGIFDLNFENYKYENVAPKEIYENEEYRFSFDELEKNKDKW